ncbi:MAG TPA: diacylglycerol kinase family protein [Candidatus Dormibacteraeota bacterium]|nr:diacylglycerol kinase family protein [Candidatus Dormibacteraeota bacterium]
MLVFVNARAWGGRGVGDGEAFEAKLRQSGFAVTLERVESLEQLNAAALRLAPDHDAIVVGGGDGSMRTALPAILKAKLPVAIWPLGTANDFARSLGIECEDDCLQALRDWVERRVDIAEVNGQSFLNNATLGLPADATRHLTPDLKQRLGILATLSLIPMLWHNAKPFEAEIEADGRVERRRIIAALVGNGKYDGGFPIRYSGLADATLHVTLCLARTRWALLPILCSVALRRMATSRRIETFSANCVAIRTAAVQLVGADGDIVTQTPATFTVRHGALRVLVPA